MRALKILRESFPYYLNDDRKNTLLAAGVGLSVFVFMTVFHPGHFDHFKLFAMIAGVIFFVLYINIVWLPKIFPDFFDPINWTIGKYILFTIWQCFMIGIVASILIHAMEFIPQFSLWVIMKMFYISTLMYGSVSIIIATFIIRNVMLKNSLRSAIRANAELEKIRNLKQPTEISAGPATMVIHSDTSETAEFNLPDLLYIEASDNYSTLYWRNGNELEKKMLRVNLKNIEAQLNNAFIIRCHRSFIVNVNAITHVRGNTNGYKLDMRDTDFTIPVSRSKGREVIEKIGQIRNLAESA